MSDLPMSASALHSHPQDVLALIQTAAQAAQA
jgi:hypothetical protein